MAELTVSPLAPQAKPVPPGVSAGKNLTPLSSGEYPSPPVMWAWVSLMAVLAAVILAFTPYTNNLDDVKVTLLHLGGGGVLALFCWLWLRNDLVLPDRRVVIPAAAWIGSLIFTTVINALGLVPNANPYQWIGFIMVGQYLALFGLFLVQATSLRTYRMVDLTLLFWVLVVFVECAFGLIHYSGILKLVYNFLYFNQASGNPVASLLATFNSSQDMLGTVLNRQFFGDLLVLWAPLCLAAAVLWTDMRRRMLAIVSLILTFPCTYLTFSKAVIPFYVISLVLTAVGIFVFTHYRRIRIPHLPYVVGGCLLILGTLVFLTKDELADRLKAIDTSLGSRSIIWKGGAGVFEAHPIFGAGPGAFRVLFPVYRDPNYHLTQISNVTLWAHNRVVDLLLEGGVVGTGLYAWMLGALFWWMWRVVRRSSDERLKVTAIALACGVGGYFCTGVFHPGMRWVIGATPYWAMLGFMAGLGQVESWHRETVASRRRGVVPLTSRQRAVRAALLVAAILIWINPLPLSHPFLYSNFGYGVRYFLGAKENNLGILYTTQLERPDLAVSAFTRAIAYNPTFVTSYYKMAHAQNLLDNIEGAKLTYERLMEYAPHYSEIHYNMGVIHRLLADDLAKKDETEQDPAKRAEEAALEREEVRKSLEQYALAAKMCNKVSIQYAYAGALQRASAFVATPEERTKLLLQSAQLYERVRTLPVTFATQEENQIADEKQMKENAWYFAPLVYSQAGDFADAGRTYRDLFRKNPADSKYMDLAVEMYLKAGQLDEARGILERAISRSPLNFKARAALAQLLAGQSDPGLLQQAYRQSLILAAMGKEFPNQIGAEVLKENQQRIAQLAGKLGHPAVGPDAAEPGPVGAAPVRPESAPVESAANVK